MPSATIRAGELRNVVSIMRPSLLQDASGGWAQDQGNQVAAGVYAKIADSSSREVYAAQQRISEVTHVIIIRWLPGVKGGMQVWFTDPSSGQRRVFRIEAVENPDNQKLHMLSLLCAEIDDSARDQ